MTQDGDSTPEDRLLRADGLDHAKSATRTIRGRERAVRLHPLIVRKDILLDRTPHPVVEALGGRGGAKVGDSYEEFFDVMHGASRWVIG